MNTSRLYSYLNYKIVFEENAASVQLTLVVALNFIRYLFLSNTFYIYLFSILLTTFNAISSRFILLYLLRLRRYRFLGGRTSST